MDRSRLTLIASVVGSVVLFVAFVAFGIVTGRTAFIPIGFIWIGVALVMRHMAVSRTRGAERQADKSSILMESYPFRVPADRVAVGRMIQWRLLPPTRDYWSPGVLCVAPQRAAFVPSKERYAARAWEGPVGRIEIQAMLNASTVRIVSPSGEQTAQFVIQVKPGELASALGGFVSVSRR